MFFIKHKKILFALIGTLSVLSLLALVVWKVVFGIEFTGGTIIEVAYDGVRPEKQVVEERLSQYDLGQYSLRPSDTDGYMLRLRDISEGEYNNVRDALSVPGTTLIEKRRATVGPVIGEELKNKAFVAISIVVVLIVLFVAFAFRKVNGNEDGEVETSDVSSWMYGFISILVLIHDILIPLGMFAVLGHFFGAEVDVLIVMALLTILGYSVNDTIIIFDRVRENLRKNQSDGVDEDFAETVGISLSQTYARSINTSLTTLIVILALLVFGGPTTMYFALTLAVGVFAGTYSSVALAAPLLVVAKERKEKKQAAK